jgi:outer membrane protein assembly factor BamA
MRAGLFAWPVLSALGASVFSLPSHSLMSHLRSGSFTALRIASLTLLLGSCVLPHVSAQAPDTSANGKLATLQITGSARFHSEQIVPSTGLSVGETITKFDIQNGADRLAQLGLFATVEYRYGSDDAGVNVEYKVTDAPTVPVWFDNFPWFTDDELTAALKRAVPLFDGTAPEGGKLLDEMSSVLQITLASRGVQSSVSHALVTAPVTDQRVQQFHADTAPVNVAGIEFGDALAQNDHGIQSRLSQDVVGKPYSRTLIELFEFEQVRPIYLAHAYLRVQFGAPSLRITGSGANARVTVVAPIAAGLAFAWGGVTWSGNAAISSADLSRFASIKTGDPADGMKTEASWDAVRDAYTERGYLDVKLAATPQFADFDRRVNYAVSITEGPQYHMGNLVLTGLSIEGERRIRASWGIASGAVFNKSIYEEFCASGIKQAFMGLPFHYEKVGRFLQQDPSKGIVDVLLDFQ